MTRITGTAFARIVAAHTIGAMALLPLAAEAADELDVGALTCKQVMQLSGGDRDATIAFLQGFLAGKSGSTQVDQEMLATATDKFIDACLDAPTKGALGILATSLGP